MNNAETPIKENMFALLKYIFADYANQLRADYPSRTIRNATVLTSGVPALARLGYIELVDARKKIPEHVPDFLARRYRRARYQPIWIPGKNFPRDPLDIFEQIKASMRGDEIIWQHVREA